MNLLFYNSFRCRCDDPQLLDYTNIWMGVPYVNAIRRFSSYCKKNGVMCQALRDFNRDSADAFAIWELPRVSMGELEQEGYQEILCSGKPVYVFLTEPPIVLPEGSLSSNAIFYNNLFTWRSDLIDHVKIFPIRPMFFEFTPPEPRELSYSQKKLCVVIGHILSNMFTSADAIYYKRKEILDWFAAHHPEDIDLYGKQPYGVGALKQYPFFCGPAEDKRKTLTKYRFSFCYENSCFPDYITEKIFDCMISGCVPIYIGAPNVDEYIPQECYINPLHFNCMDELYQYISTMKETVYNNYIAAAGEFLESNFAKSYQPDELARTLLKVIKR